MDYLKLTSDGINIPYFPKDTTQLMTNVENLTQKANQLNLALSQLSGVQKNEVFQIISDIVTPRLQENQMQLLFAANQSVYLPTQTTGYRKVFNNGVWSQPISNQTDIYAINGGTVWITPCSSAGVVEGSFNSTFEMNYNNELQQILKVPTGVTQALCDYCPQLTQAILLGQSITAVHFGNCSNFQSIDVFPNTITEISLMGDYALSNIPYIMPTNLVDLYLMNTSVGTEYVRQVLNDLSQKTPLGAWNGIYFIQCVNLDGSQITNEVNQATSNGWNIYL